MSDQETKVIDDLNSKLTSRGEQLYKDLSQFLGKESNFLLGVNGQDDLDKNDPNIVKLNRELSDFIEYLNKVKKSVSDLLFTIEKINIVSSEYLHFTCQHVFVDKEITNFLGHPLKFNMCDKCGKINRNHRK